MSGPQDSRPSRRRRAWTALATIVIVALGLAGFFSIGAQQPLWLPTSHRDPLAFALQIVVSLIFMAVAFFAFLWIWHFRHRDSVPEWRIAQLEDIPGLTERNASELLADIEKHYKYLGDFADNDAVEAFTQTLLKPQEYRLSVTEEAVIRGSQLMHTVSVLWADQSWSNLSTGRIVPLYRAPKADLPRELELVDGHRVLNSRETLRIFDLVLIRLSRLNETDLSSVQSDAARRTMLQLVAQRPSAPDLPSVDAATRAVDLALSAARNDNGVPHEVGEPSPLLAELLALLRDRRPYLQYDPQHSTGAWTSQFTYRTDLVKLKNPPRFDRWRRFKDWGRIQLRQLPRVVYVSLERAEYAANYRLKLSCDGALYFEEILVWGSDSRVWLPRMSRSENFDKFIGWEPPKGKAFTSLTAINLSPPTAPALKNLFLMVRMREKPPGSLAAAASVTLATLVAVWVVGLVRADTSQGVDYVAFVLALPAVAAGALGLRTSEKEHGLRSITAIIASAVSFVVSLVAIVLYLAESNPASEDDRQALQPWRLWNHVYLFYLSDAYWIVLFVVEAATFAVVFGTAILRGVRYASLTSRRTRVESN